MRRPFRYKPHEPARVFPRREYAVFAAHRRWAALGKRWLRLTRVSHIHSVVSYTSVALCWMRCVGCIQIATYASVALRCMRCVRYIQIVTYATVALRCMRCVRCIQIVTSASVALRCMRCVRCIRCTRTVYRLCIALCVSYT